MKPALVAALLARADGSCECGCRRSFGGSIGSRVTLDHFFSRARAESLETVWALREDCHRNKTDSRPSAKRWHLAFITHCERYSYHEAAEQARRRLEGIIAMREARP